MKNKTKKIYIQWNGPYLYNDEEGFKINQIEKYHKNSDYGLYQIYGSHPIYGHNCLLYIGRTVAADMTFSKRVIDKKWSYWRDKTIYLGRFSDIKSVDESDWTNQIKFAEALFINYLTPAWNSSGINDHIDIGLFDSFSECYVVNYGNRMSLPEVMKKDDWSCQTQISDNDRRLILEDRLKIFVWNEI